MGFCAFLEVPRTQNHMRNFQKGTKSHIELPKIYKIPRETSKSAQNPTRIFKKCTKSQEKLPNMHKILRGSFENVQDLLIDFK
jgi:hypothetical protein